MYTSSNGQKCFSYRVATLWNNLAIGVKQAPSLLVVKKRLLLDFVSSKECREKVIGPITKPRQRKN